VFSRYQVPSKKVLIISSKDRAAQLDILLTSIEKFCTNYDAIVIIYSASNSDFQRGYSKLLRNYRSNKYILFVKEVNYRNDLIAIISEIDHSCVCMLVDDIEFINFCDFSMFNGFSMLKYQPSLRLGRNIRRSWISEIGDMPHPQFSVLKRSLLSWRHTKSSFDWAYVYSLDGDLFHSNILAYMLSMIDFQNPNSLETNLQFFRYATPLSRGLCSEKSLLVNHPVNKVQVENDNFSMNGDPELLNKQYLHNRTISYGQMEHLEPISVHEPVEVLIK
jgi:hypothetical protein